MCNRIENNNVNELEGFTPVPGIPGLFVSKAGDVRLLNKKGEIICPHMSVTGRGYLRIAYGDGRYYVHRLVALTYLPNPRNCKYVNHKNGNKKDNRVENLEWVTASENWRHAIATGLARSIGEITRKLSDEDVRYIRSVNESAEILAERFHVTTRTILKVRSGATYKDIE